MTREEAVNVIENRDSIMDYCESAQFGEALEMAIKALEQAPCEDCISRKAVLDGIDNYIEKVQSTGAKDDFISFEELVVKALPSIQPKPKTEWIPVSERLPNFAGTYLVTRYFPNNVMNPTYLVDACFFDGSDTWHNDNRINHERKYLTNVVAWLEEPEPYKAESEEE